MYESFIGEVRAFPYTFAPVGWLDCQGQLVSISQYQALFSVVGFMYGGDQSQRSTFGLPDLRGRAAMGKGQGPGLTHHAVGARQGDTTVALNLSQLPNHTHALNTRYMSPAAAASALSDTPTNQSYPSRLIDKALAQPVSLEIFKPRIVPTPPPPAPAPPATQLVAMSAMAVSTVPPPQQAVAPHENRQPYLALRFCICYEGIYPFRD